MSRRRLLRNRVSYTKLRDLLKETRDELVQLHSYYYKDCGGGCPAEDIIRRVDLALKRKGRQMQECPSCEELRDLRPGLQCPHCGHVEVEETEE